MEPADLAAVIGRDTSLCHVGHGYDGRESAASEEEISRVAADVTAKVEVGGIACWS
jgi:hypothetical protein